jgi:hypothetical protein
MKQIKITVEEFKRTDIGTSIIIENWAGVIIGRDKYVDKIASGYAKICYERGDKKFGLMSHNLSDGRVQVKIFGANAYRMYIPVMSICSLCQGYIYVTDYLCGNCREELYGS